MLDADKGFVPCLCYVMSPQTNHSGCVSDVPGGHGDLCFYLEFGSPVGGLYHSGNPRVWEDFYCRSCCAWSDEICNKKIHIFSLFLKKSEKRKSFAQNLFVCVLLTQVLHDGLSSPRFWVCRRIDLPRVWGDVFRTSELLRSGMCVIFIKKITKKKASQINFHMDYTRKSKLKG